MTGTAVWLWLIANALSGPALGCAVGAYAGRLLGERRTPVGRGGGSTRVRCSILLSGLALRKRRCDRVQAPAATSNCFPSTPPDTATASTAEFHSPAAVA